VDDALGVRGREDIRDLPRDRERTRHGCATPRQPARKTLALEELHCDVRATVGVEPEVVDLHDAGVAHRSGRPRFIEEPRDLFGVLREHRQQHLHRGRPTQEGMARQIDLTHATLADRPRDLIAADRLQHVPRLYSIAE